MNMLVTIFTATYNRAYTLTRLYESICAQTIKSFEWIVVDDASTDSTEELIGAFVKDDKIKIKYMKKSVGGEASCH